MIRHLYEYSGLSRTDVHLALQEWMIHPPSKERVFDVLEGRKRFRNRWPSVKGYAERRKDTYQLHAGGFIKKDQRDDQLTKLRRNYVLHSATLNNVEPSFFKDDVRGSMAPVEMYNES